MSRTVTIPSLGVDANELASFCASLEEVEQAAGGYGRLVAATVETELSGVVVVATYNEFRWAVTFKGVSA